MLGNIARGLSTDQARVLGAKSEDNIPSTDLKQLLSYLLRSYVKSLPKRN